MKHSRNCTVSTSFYDMAFFVTSLRKAKLYICTFLLTLIFGVHSHVTHAQAKQVPLLERTLTLNVDNKKAVDVFADIEKQTGCSFSYNAALIPETRLVSVHANKRSTREVLDKMFTGEIHYKTKGNYIILTKAPAKPKVIAGYVENAKGEKVAGASVYDESTMASATTNEYGYYEMKIKRDNPTMRLSVSKSNYSDTVIPLQPSAPTLQNIVIEEQKDTTLSHIARTVADSLRSKWNSASDWTVEQFARNKNVENISDTIYRDFQFSFVPFVGTNGRLSGNTVSDWSFNVLGGYNRGVRKGELAGLFNIDREDVSYGQIAGLANLVGGNVHGMQMGGLLNADLQDVKGLQIGGLVNFNLGTFEGVQMGGLINFNRKESHATHFAGLINVTTGNSRGAAFAGILNSHLGNYKGAQFAGLINLASGEINGAQIAGLVNVAKTVKGTQIGFLNISDSLSGIPIGFISYVHKGYHKLEVSSNDLFYLNASLRTGVNQFYNIINVGIQPKQRIDTNSVWTYGYGIGTAPKINRWLFLNIDLTGNTIMQKKTYSTDGTGDDYLVERKAWESFNLDNQLYLGAEVRLTKKIALTGGALVHCYLTDRDVLYPSIYDGGHPHYISEGTYDEVNMKVWVGWKVGVRFF